MIVKHKCCTKQLIMLILCNLSKLKSMNDCGKNLSSFSHVNATVLVEAKKQDSVLYELY